MIRLFTALALIAATPLAAQNLNFSDRPTRTCLAANDTTHAKIGCIGLAANACMEATPGGGSTVGMAGCLDAELQYWDGRLNRIYGRLRDRERGTGTADELLAMQRSWITFRDNRCGYEAAQWGGGTGAGPAYAACLMQMTGEQALFLRSMER